MTGSCRLPRRRAAVLLAAVLSLAGQGVCRPVQAATLGGVTMPDTMTVQGTMLRLNGMGLRSFTFLKIHGFVAGLYVPQPGHDAGPILDMPGLKLLRIQYVHAASLARVQDEFRQGRQRSCADRCPRENDAAFEQLLGTARAVEPGNTTTYVYSPDGVQVLFNDRSLTMIRNADFARRMLDGMIGAHPPSASLRDGLLGNGRDGAAG